MEHQRERDDTISRALADRLLAGWALLASNCPNPLCATASLMRSPDRTVELCVSCNQTRPLNDAGAANGGFPGPPGRVGAGGAAPATPATSKAAAGGLGGGGAGGGAAAAGGGPEDRGDGLSAILESSPAEEMDEEEGTAAAAGGAAAPHEEWKERQRRFDAHSGVMAKHMLQGWALLDSNCPLCYSPLMRDRQKRLFCVVCDMPVMDGNEPGAHEIDPPKDRPMPANPGPPLGGGPLSDASARIRPEEGAAQTRGALPAPPRASQNGVAPAGSPVRPAGNPSLPLPRSSPRAAPDAFGRAAAVAGSEEAPRAVTLIAPATEAAPQQSCGPPGVAGDDMRSPPVPILLSGVAYTLPPGKHRETSTLAAMAPLQAPTARQGPPKRQATSPVLGARAARDEAAEDEWGQEVVPMNVPASLDTPKGAGVGSVETLAAQTLETVRQKLEATRRRIALTHDSTELTQLLRVVTSCAHAIMALQPLLDTHSSG